MEGLVFTMVSDLGKLKRKVDLLGSPKDTLSHRWGCMHTLSKQQGCLSACCARLSSCAGQAQEGLGTLRHAVGASGQAGA